MRLIVYILSSSLLVLRYQIIKMKPYELAQNAYASTVVYSW